MIRLAATASIWLADTTPAERDSSAGLVPIVKLKSIQEMAAVRFDARPVRGRQIRSARLFLHLAGADQLRYLRVSTVNQDWTAGTSHRPYGPASGATYHWADATRRVAWSFPGSEFADVVMGSGQSLTTFDELRREPGGWVSVSLTPDLVYALAIGQTDGLAVMDGGTPALFNNFVHGASAGRFAPYIDVEPGPAFTGAPPAPVVTAAAAPARAHLTTGAVAVTIQSADDVFCWDVAVDGTPVPRWQVPFPPTVARSGREQALIRTGRAPPSGAVTFHLDDLAPGRAHALAVTAVGRGGERSSTVALTVQASAALTMPPRLGPAIRAIRAALPGPGADRGQEVSVPRAARFSTWPVPGAIKISPETGLAMAGDMAGNGRGTSPNAVWDGQAVQLFGAGGEYVSYQLVIERVDPAESLTDLHVVPSALVGEGGAIDAGHVELFRNWYARNADGAWQPAYAIPLTPDQPFEIPDRQRALDAQANQSVTVDVYIPKDAPAGIYTGEIRVRAGADALTLPVRLQVYDFTLPDTLRFWVELNAYRLPSDLLAFHRLAHQHRLVFNPWVIQPVVQGAGAGITVDWERYDAVAGPLLSGAAFAGNRRVGVPTPVMYLPFIDSWPTPLTPETYDYPGHWPGPGESPDTLVAHYLTAPYIGDGLSDGYTAAFRAVERQFVAHFRQQGWHRTEMQLFFGGKNTHRLDYGSNMWWTTDEPYHWDDWLALQFFGNLWVTERRARGADPAIWSVRADLSRPMWAGRVLDSIVDHVYWGGFVDDRSFRRAAWLEENAGLHPRAYGSVNPATESNTRAISTLLQAWLHGADAFLPWQTLGDDASLDLNDDIPGNTLLVPGDRFGVPVVGDLRLKALRDGEQLIEYLAILADRYHLQREQLAAVLEQALPLSVSTVAGASRDDAGRAHFGTLQAWQISEVRRALADWIVGARP